MSSQAECDVIDTFEDVCDINDVFDSIALSEVHFSKKGYEEGFKEGEVTGKSEGFHLGYHRGAEIGAEIGYYTGVVESLLAISQSSDTQLSAKLVDSINKVSELLKQFPNTNSEDIDLIALRDNIKARYKKTSEVCKEVVIQNMHVEVLRSRLDEIVRFVKPLLPLANCHMVNFFTDHLWEAFIPGDIRAEVETMDVSDVCNVFWKRTDNGECPSLQRYLDAAADHTVCGVALSHEELLLKLERRGHEPPCRLHIKQFMSPKKGHEVEQMSQAVATVAAAARWGSMVDQILPNLEEYINAFVGSTSNLKQLIYGELTKRKPRAFQRGSFTSCMECDHYEAFSPQKLIHLHVPPGSLSYIITGLYLVTLPI